MKKALYTLATMFFSVSAFAQGSAGLIAHWNFNGQSDDVSGNNHTGHQHNVTLDTGMTGIPNTAYRFNGVNSWISAPYLPDLNVANYSICAIVKVEGFYSGTCQNNVIIVRGKTGPGNCVYTLQFNDKPATNNDCFTLDSTKECFWTGSAGPTATLSPSSVTDYSYTPYIQKGRWYKVVATFNDTAYKLYIDGALTTTTYVANPGVPLGSGTDSISIGYALNESYFGYPYPFKGLIDDIKIYNRVLNDTEVTMYGDTCGTIVADLSPVSVAPGGTTSLSVGTTIYGATYQWQCDPGTGFVNLTNSGPYSGVTTNNLIITGVTAAMNAYHYRCVVGNAAACRDTSASVPLVVNVGVNDVLTTEMISVMPNPASSYINVNVPNNITGSVTLINQLGQALAYQTLAEKITIDMHQLPTGIYLLRFATKDGIVCKKFVKL
jgi:hypothetical protein